MEITRTSLKGLQPTNSTAADRLTKEKARLHKATEDFESYFMTYMIGAMRETIPEQSEESGGLSSGMGKDVFQSLFDQELGKKMAAGTRDGIGDVLYKQLEPTLEQQIEPQQGIERPQPSHPLKNLEAMDQPKMIALKKSVSE